MQVNDDGNIASLVTTEDSGAKDDVTGGMRLKLSTAIAIQVGRLGFPSIRWVGGWVRMLGARLGAIMYPREFT